MPKFKYVGRESKNFGRHELIRPGQIIETQPGKETTALVDHPEFTEVKENPGKEASK